jgi:hypothetical protein
MSEIKLNYTMSKDRLNCFVVDKDNGIIKSFLGQPCFSIMLGSIFPPIINDPQAQYLDVYYHDTLSEQLGEEGQAGKFLALLKKMGLLRYTQVDLLTSEQVPVELLSTEGNSYHQSGTTIRVRFDIDVISSAEMFLVGNAIRVIHIHPYIAYNFMKYVKMHSDVSLWITFLIAHKLRSDASGRTTTGHCITNYSLSSILMDMDDAHAYIDNLTFGCVRNTPSYNKHGYWNQKLVVESYIEEIKQEYSAERFLSLSKVVNKKEVELTF